MKPGYFIAFKAVWCVFVGVHSVWAGFLSATCDKTFKIIRERFAEPAPEGSWRASRQGRSLPETQYGAAVVGRQDIQSGDL